ncbi:MAG TPA: ATP-binding cassette domain-containing protein [Burkholderiales bacterium]|nr:ATP-binding cassette domain-containing protein [Burkholderiales bacterium]
MSAARVVALRDLIFRWTPRDEPCVDITHLEIGAGERVFLHGPSGSGKSTLLGLLGGVLAPERGSIRFLDAELTQLGARARDRFRADHVGFIFQQFNLIPYLSAIENVLLPCRFSTRRGRRAAVRSRTWLGEAARLLRQLDLEPGLDRRPAMRLSVGQQQRVAAARALIGQPEFVIADEPTSALDAERQQAFLALLLRECSDAGAALLFVSHDRRLAGAFDRELAMPSLNRADAAREAA